MKSKKLDSFSGNSQQSARVLELPTAKQINSFASYKAHYIDNINWYTQVADDTQNQAQQQQYATQSSLQYCSMLQSGCQLILDRTIKLCDLLDQFLAINDTSMALDLVEKLEININLIQSKADSVAHTLSAVQAYARSSYSLTESCNNVVIGIADYQRVLEELISIAESQDIQNDLHEMQDLAAFVTNKLDGATRVAHFVQELAQGIQYTTVSVSTTLSTCNRMLDSVVRKVTTAKQSLALD